MTSRGPLQTKLCCDPMKTIFTVCPELSLPFDFLDDHIRRTLFRL